MESSRSWSRCPCCGFRCYRVWDRRVKRVRDLGVSGRRTTLVWRRRRFWCGNCEERHLEDHDQFQGSLTRGFLTGWSKTQGRCRFGRWRAVMGWGGIGSWAW
ncbi:transposase family protein [Candidatus Spongiisocius sp.]|uniref:transposase family protein n=1 Tax=Candidatus Spongiisocius sp. TaxID=3101273 RepID=UPI003B59C65E